MKLVKKILNRLNGLHYTQEYLCTAREIFKEPLHVYIVEEGKPVKDITCSHLFTGYCPLVFAFASAKRLAWKLFSAKMCCQPMLL
jgi:hypothetical protein